MTDSPHIDTFTADLLALRHIPAKDLEREQDLAKKCWWEYRGVHPTVRTMLFAEEFVAARQRYTSKYIDSARAEYVSGMRGSQNIFADLVADDAELALMTEAQRKREEKRIATRKRNLTGLWRARQAADELTINYRLYVSSIFEHASTNGWSRLPLATQLYGDKQKMIALDAQVNELESYIPDFTNEGLMAGSDAPFKPEFDTWLYEFGLLRRVHKDLAYKRMADQGYITPDQAADWTALAESR